MKQIIRNKLYNDQLLLKLMKLIRMRSLNKIIRIEFNYKKLIQLKIRKIRKISRSSKLNIFEQAKDFKQNKLVTRIINKKKISLKVKPKNLF